MFTTIKITKETRKRLLSLDLAEKGKTFDALINELVTSYQRSRKQYDQDHQDWRKNVKEHAKALETYQKEKAMWDRLLVWAKRQGFKG